MEYDICELLSRHQQAGISLKRCLIIRQVINSLAQCRVMRQLLKNALFDPSSADLLGRQKG